MSTDRPDLIKHTSSHRPGLLTRQRRKALGDVVWWIVVGVFLLLFNFPIISTLFTSLKTNLDIASSPPKWLFAPTLEHYENVLYAAGYDFPRFFLNSAVIALGGSLLTILITLPAAYSIVRFRTGGGFLFPYVISLRLLPPILFAIPLFIIFRMAGLIDTWTGLILVNALMNTPLALLLFVGFVQDFPQEVEEAGMIDGASTFQILRLLLFPLLLPSLAAVAALSFIWAWNEYLFAFILTFRSATTVTVGASLFITAWGIRWGDIAAAIFLSVLPTLAFVFFVQRYLVRGLTLGAVKG